MCRAWQLQGSQPRGPPRFQKRGAQRLQSRPSVWGRQGHCPLTRSQKQASAPGGHLTGLVPRGSQLQPGDRKGLTGAEECESTPSLLGTPSPPHPHTHAGSPLGAGHCRGSQAGSGHSQCRGCGADSAGNVHCEGRRRLGHGDQYCCCTGRAGMDSFWGHLQARGARSSRRSSGHSGGLEWIKVERGLF